MVSIDNEPLSTNPLEAGQEALTRGAWQEARLAFEAALIQKETPEALEGLGMATAWLDDASVMFDAREHAYRLYLEGDNRRSAARVAVALARDYFTFRGELAIAQGWLQRARRLLEGLESSPEFGWLTICEAHLALWTEYDSATVQRLCAHAVSLGRSLGDINIEMLALAYEGVAWVSQGMISAGMRCLDEAATAVVAGEMTNIDAACTACCCLIYACEQVRDYERAAQWCERLEALAKRWSYPMMFSVCRTYYAGLLIWQGTWDKAEAELAAAIHELGTTRPARAAEGLVRLAMLRCSQGRLEEAAVLLEQAESPPYRMHAGHLYLLGRAVMALEQDNPETAINLAERFLRILPGEARVERAAALELLIQAWIAFGDRTRAEDVLAEFRSVVTAVTTKPMQASVHFAEGTVAVAAGDYETAKRCFEDALELWAQSGAPVETAQARIELAAVLVALGCSDAAEQEVSAALESLQTIGAAGAAMRAAVLLHQLKESRGGHASQSSNLPQLTGREVEILSLVAQGLSNKEIAAQLVLSEHTVHRHMGNILTKLGLSSRAAAAVYAAQHKLL
jgi:LuxR family transcriptional regulator, maltose regulon positive regulatory protein